MGTQWSKVALAVIDVFAIQILTDTYFLQIPDMIVVTTRYKN